MAKKGIWDGVFARRRLNAGGPPSCKTVATDAMARVAGDRGPVVKGDRFVTDWEKGSVNRLFLEDSRHHASVQCGTGDSGDKVDIVAYLLQVNGFPSGNSDCSSSRATLEAIQIVKKGAEASGLPNFSLVQAVGCLTPGQNKRWILTNASDPVATKDESATPATLKTAAAKALGTQTLELVSVSPSFNPDAHKSQKVEVRGLLYRDPKYVELNLTSLEGLSSSCSN